MSVGVDRTIFPTQQSTQVMLSVYTKKYAVSVKLRGSRLTLQRWILISSEMKSYTKVKAPNDCEPT